MGTALLVEYFNELPNAKWEVPTTIFEGDLLFIEWKADAGSTRVEDGVDTFLFREGESGPRPPSATR